MQLNIIENEEKNLENLNIMEEIVIEFLEYTCQEEEEEGSTNNCSKTKLPAVSSKITYNVLERIYNDHCYSKPNTQSKIIHSDHTYTKRYSYDSDIKVGQKNTTVWDMDNVTKDRHRFINSQCQKRMPKMMSIGKYNNIEKHMPKLASFGKHNDFEKCMPKTTLLQNPKKYSLRNSNKLAKSNYEIGGKFLISNNNANKVPCTAPPNKMPKNDVIHLNPVIIKEELILDDNEEISNSEKNNHFEDQIQPSRIKKEIVLVETMQFDEYDNLDTDTTTDVDPLSFDPISTEVDNEMNANEYEEILEDIPQSYLQQNIPKIKLRFNPNKTIGLQCNNCSDRTTIINCQNKSECVVCKCQDILFLCIKCNKNYDSLKKLHMHFEVASVHGQSRTLLHEIESLDNRLNRCLKCARYFLDSMKLKRHRKICTQSYKCPECLYEISQLQTLERHIRIRHLPKGPDFSCKECKKETRSSFIWGRHVSVCRVGWATNWMCSICKEYCRSKIRLSLHKRICKPRTKVKLSKCHKYFNSLN